MFSYVLGRFAVMIPTLFVISIVTFIIIQLPPGDYLTTYAAQLREQGDEVDEVLMARLKQRYGLGQPQHIQYLKWIGLSLNWLKSRDSRVAKLGSQIIAE